MKNNIFNVSAITQQILPFDIFIKKLKSLQPYITK